MTRLSSVAFALAITAATAAQALAQETLPRYAGVDPNLGPAATTWSGTAFTVAGITFAGFDVQEEAAIRRTLGALPSSLSADGFYAEKGGADSYTPAGYGGRVVIIGENQVFGDDGEGGTADDFLTGSLAHEMAHAWAQRSGPDQNRYLFWSFGNTVGGRFANSEDAFVNEYARSCVQAARELLGFLRLGAIDPHRLAAASGLFEEDFANTVHERFLSQQRGVPIHWIDIDREAVSDPEAGQLKLARVEELLDW